MNFLIQNRKNLNDFEWFNLLTPCWHTLLMPTIVSQTGSSWKLNPLLGTIYNTANGVYLNDHLTVFVLTKPLFINLRHY